MAIGIVQQFISFWEGSIGHALCLVGPLSDPPISGPSPADPWSDMPSVCDAEAWSCLKTPSTAINEDHLLCSANCESCFAQYNLCHVTHHDKQCPDDAER